MWKSGCVDINLIYLVRAGPRNLKTRSKEKNLATFRRKKKEKVKMPITRFEPGLFDKAKTSNYRYTKRNLLQNMAENN